MMLSEIKVGLAGYLYLFACYGVDEYQFRRMKIHPVCFLSIQLIAYNGMVEPLRMSGVYAQLMGSSGLREKGNECIPVFKRNLFISGYGRFPPTVVYHLSRAVHQVWAEGKRDGSFVLLQFWNLFNARVFGTTHSALGHLAKSYVLVGVAAIILIGQYIIVQFGGEVFRTTPLDWQTWLILLAGTSPVLWIGELLRLFQKLRK